MEQLAVASASRSGADRADAVRADADSAVIAVANGIGRSGRSAAEHALAAVWTHANELLDPDVMQFAFEAANRAVRATNPDSGSTLTVAALDSGRATLGHVGDARAWLCRDGSGTVLTVDHTTRGARVDGERLLERYIGMDSAGVDIDVVDLLPGDVLVVCTEGIWSGVTVEEAGAMANTIPASGLPNRLLLATLESGDASVAVAGLPRSASVEILGPRNIRMKPGEQVTFGRSSDDVAVDLAFLGNPHLSAHAGSIIATAQGWSLSNVGRYLSFEMTDAIGGAILRVDPGEQIVGTSARTIVSWLGPTGVDRLTVLCEALKGTRSPIKQAPPTSTIRPYDLARAPRQLLVAVALCEPILLDPTASEIPTDRQVAERLGGLGDPMSASRVAKIVNESLLPRILADIPAFGGRSRGQLVRRLLLTGTVRARDLSLLPALPLRGPRQT